MAATSARVEAGVVVEQVEVGRGVEQALRLVLAVERGEERGQLAQERDGHQRAVDRGPAFPGGMDLAADHDLVVLHGQAVLLQERFGDGPSARASTAARSSPVRMRSAEARSPRTRPSASIRMDFPRRSRR